MSQTPTHCPACQAENIYPDGPLWTCAECSHEWDASAATPTEGTTAEVAGVKDAFGTVLATGDAVTLIKDLKIKGAGSSAKVGTKVKNIRLVDGADGHNIVCKIDGVGQIYLKSEFKESLSIMGMRAYHRRQFAKEIILSKYQPPGPFPLVLVLDHMKSTFNIGKIVRTANALGIREIHLVGIPIFDLRTARGALRHTRSRRFETFAESYETLAAEGYQFFALAPQAEETLGAKPLPEKSAFIVGHEEFGLSFDPVKFPAIQKLRIPQFGRVQSLNASIAASISCFEYLRQHGFTPPAKAEAVVNESASPCPFDGKAPSPGPMASQANP